MTENEIKKAIDWRTVFGEIKKRKKLFFKILPVVLVVSYLLMLDVPRYYSTSMSLAPEMGGQGGSGGTLSSIASSFGIDLADMETSDAINPMLYPDLMNDNGFVAKLFTIHVQSADRSIDTDYYTYLSKHQKYPWWINVKAAIVKLFQSKKDTAALSPNEILDPYNIPKKTESIMSAIRDKVTFDYDKKTGIVNIMVKDQDPLICKTVADSLSTILQVFITDYRTNKARTDAKHYERMTEIAHEEYDSIRHLYERTYDSNNNVVLQSVRGRIEYLENEMQTKYSEYTAYSAQLQNAKARIQERTPVFTVLKGASRPNQIAGPKRVLTAFYITILVGLCLCIYVLKDILKP